MKVMAAPHDLVTEGELADAVKQAFDGALDQRVSEAADEFASEQFVHRGSAAAATAERLTAMFHG